MRRFTAPIPWSFLSDAEWVAIRTFVAHTSAGGRPLAPVRPDILAPGPEATLRHRFDAILHIAVTGQPWRTVPVCFGKPDTVARHFRRLAHAGVFQKLLFALTHPACPPALKKIEYWICRAARRAMRLLGMRGLEIANHLGLLSALPMVPWLLPNRGLSETAFALVDREFSNAQRGIRPREGWLRDLRKLLAIAAGRRRWSKAFAPA